MYKRGDRVRVRVAIHGQNEFERVFIVGRAELYEDRIDREGVVRHTIETSSTTCIACGETVFELLENGSPIELCRHDLPRLHPRHIAIEGSLFEDGTSCEWRRAGQSCHFEGRIHRHCYAELYGARRQSIQDLSRSR